MLRQSNDTAGFGYSSTALAGASAMAMPAVAGPARLEPAPSGARRWPVALGAALTVAMMGSLSRSLAGSGLAGLGRAVPGNWLYYVAFALLYLSPALADFIIFRRLWRIPTGGFAALLRKRIANEVVLGYSGDAYFYAWARQRTQMVTAPFGAVKDSMILSAVAGNAVTLAMIGLALPAALDLLDAGQLRYVALSAGFVVAISLPFLLFSKRVFSLSSATLRWIFAVHFARQAASSLLIALAWHFALPGVGIGTWLVLAAARAMVSRLPFPNKELLFASFATALIGQSTELSGVVAFTAALTLAVHLALMLGFGVEALLRRPASLLPVRHTA